MSAWPAHTPARIAAFAGALVLIAGGAAALGSAIGATPPLQDCLEAAAIRAGLDEDAAGGHGGEDGEATAVAVPGADGLQPTLAGVELRPEAQALAAGRTTEWRFRVMGCDGDPIRDFELEQGKVLHLIVVRSDFTGYQHLHPVLGRDGTFSTPLATPEPGRYRAIADFVVDGRKYVVGTDLVVPGRPALAPLPPQGDTASVDGYDVELERPAVLKAGEDAQMTFRVSRDGRPVTGLEPYLGAYGHLVALHAPDLAYSHVHPDGEDRAHGAITFDVDLDEPGRYRLFLQFQTRGRVHTVAFTQSVT